MGQGSCGERVKECLNMDNVCDLMWEACGSRCFKYWMSQKVIHV